MIFNETHLKFGVEIEINHSFTSIDEIVEFIKDDGLPCFSPQELEIEFELQRDVKGYGDSDEYKQYFNSHWCVKNDDSCGYEITSPILTKADYGFDKIRRISDLLYHLGVSTDKRCGLHIHIDMNMFTLDEIRAIFMRYHKSEKYIDLMVDETRHDDRNSLIQPSADRLNYELFYEAKTYEQLALSQYSRQSKLNLKSLPKYGTLEFRHHHGTIYWDEIINWIEFLFIFIQSTNKRNVTDPFTLQYLNDYDGKSFEFYTDKMMVAA